MAERELVTSLEELSETRQELMQSERRRSLVGSMQKLSACADLKTLSQCLLDEAITLTSAAGGEVSLERAVTRSRSTTLAGVGKRAAGPIARRAASPSSFRCWIRQGRRPSARFRYAPNTD